MKPLLFTLGLLGLLVGTTLVLRHASLLLMPPTGSVLDRFDDRTAQDSTASLNIDELSKQYEKVRSEIKVLDAGKTEEEKNQVNIWKEPYKTENRLRSAIQTRESQGREIAEVHYFWWCGFVCALLSIFVFRYANRWFAVALLTTGFVQMLYGTSPAIRFLGGTLEFEGLLYWKFVYTAASLGWLLAAWTLLHRWTAAASPIKA